MKLFIIAGEESGDLHASNLIRELKKLQPNLEIHGIGGERMKSVGMQLLHNMVGHAVVGFWEVAKNYGFFRKVMYDCVAWIQTNKPDVVILVDYPGFNLRLAERIHHLNIPVIYYISPQVWAWGKRRIPKIAKLVSKMILILPFETETYSGTNLDAEFVGHPLLDVIKVNKSKQKLCLENHLNPDLPVITLLPGSRYQELHHHLSVMLDAGRRMKNELPDLQFVLLLVHNKYQSFAEKSIAKSGLPVTIALYEKYDWRAISELTIVASGTATLETAILGTPMIIIYQVSFFTYFFARWMIKLPYIGLTNLIAGKKVVPEIVQYDLTPENLSSQALALLKDKSKLQEIRSELAQVRSKLGQPGASFRAAQSILNYLNRK